MTKRQYLGRDPPTWHTYGSGQGGNAPRTLRPPQLRGKGPLDHEELRVAYHVNHSSPPHTLVEALWGHFLGLDPDRRFAVAPLPHGATIICVRQLQALLSPGERTPDSLVDMWIWWLNIHQPDQGRVWVPHLALAHTLIAPPPAPGLHQVPGAQNKPRLS